MNTLKAIGIVLLAIVVVAAFFSVGAFLAFAGFVIAVITMGALFIVYVVSLIKAHINSRNK